MRPRRGVDLLPTISETQEGDWESGCPAHSMEEYLDSIKELSQTAIYPLHGPLRGHRRWTGRHVVPRCPGSTPLPVPHPCMAFAPWAALSPSQMAARRPDYAASTRPPRDPLDWLFGQALFAGLT